MAEARPSTLGIGVVLVYKPRYLLANRFAGISLVGERKKCFCDDAEKQNSHFLLSSFLASLDMFYDIN